MHWVGLVPWKQAWSWINTTLNKAKVKSVTFNHITIGKATRRCEKRYQTWWGYSFKIRTFLSWFSQENGCKIFIKIMSNSIVGNLVWITAYIIIKLAMEIPEVTRIELKVCWYWKMVAFLEDAYSKMRWIWSMYHRKSWCKLWSRYLRVK